MVVVGHEDTLLLRACERLSSDRDSSADVFRDCLTDAGCVIDASLDVCVDGAGFFDHGGRYVVLPKSNNILPALLLLLQLAYY